MRFNQRLHCKLKSQDNKTVIYFRAMEIEKENLTGSFMGGGNANTSQTYKIFTTNSLICEGLKNKTLLPYKCDIFIIEKDTENKYILSGSFIKSKKIMSGTKSKYAAELALE